MSPRRRGRGSGRGSAPRPIVDEIVVPLVGTNPMDFSRSAISEGLAPSLSKVTRKVRLHLPPEGVGAPKTIVTHDGPSDAGGRASLARGGPGVGSSSTRAGRWMRSLDSRIVQPRSDIRVTVTARPFGEGGGGPRGRKRRRGGIIRARGTRSGFRASPRPGPAVPYHQRDRDRGTASPVWSISAAPYSP